MMCYLANVSGKVQGVYFRVSCQQIAIDLQLSGYAKNLSNGNVEVLVCGEQANIDKMLAWLKQGPDQAQVSDVEYSEVAWQEYNHFSIS